MILIKTITAGTEWHLEADGRDCRLVCENVNGRFTFDMTWTDARLIADRLLQGLVDNDEAMPFEELGQVMHIDDLGPVSATLAEAGIGMPAPWGGTA